MTELPVRVNRVLSQVSYLLLLLLIVLRGWRIEALAAGAVLVLVALQALPLLLFARGVWRGAPRTLMWLCFALLFYFLLAADRVSRNNSVGADIAELITIVVLFVAAMLYARYRAREMRRIE